LERKFNLKILKSLSTVILKFVPKAAAVFLSSFFSCSLVDFLQWLATSHWMQKIPPTSYEPFRNNFNDHGEIFWVTGGFLKCRNKLFEDGPTKA
jgi:hypothetical protein